MADHTRIRKPPKDSRPSLTTTPARARGLPPDLLRQASRRLEIIALTGAALWVFGPLLGHLARYLTRPGDPQWAEFRMLDIIAAISVTTSLALYAYVHRRSDRHAPDTVMDLGLVYLVATAFAIGLMMHTSIRPGQVIEVEPMISWTGPVMLMFAAIVPATPTRFLVAGLAAASMDPLGMVVWKAAGGYDFGPLRVALAMHYPNYLLLGVAVMISRVVNRLGQQVSRERELGSYRLGELLGRGGMGDVYLAQHRMLARPAAIKLIRPAVLAAGDGDSAQMAITRFRREADAAARLQSPHTVALYDFGVTEDETLYLVMELLDGLDLETLVREHGAVPASRVVHILRQVCESLAEAHASGMVHRDIKPANIHLGRLGLRHDFVKVLDFGLVKSVAEMDASQSMETAQGLTPGTPAYLAPEIALGDAVDGRADLYAVGCVAYFLLTGQVVFEAETGFQMVARHIRSEPVPPSRRTTQLVVPELDRVILACLAKAPEDRPQSAADLEGQLRALPIEQWTQTAAREWWQARGTTTTER